MHIFNPISDLSCVLHRIRLVSRTLEQLNKRIIYLDPQKLVLIDVDPEVKFTYCLCKGLTITVILNEDRMSLHLLRIVTSVMPAKLEISICNKLTPKSTDARYM